MEPNYLAHENTLATQFSQMIWERFCHEARQYTVGLGRSHSLLLYVISLDKKCSNKNIINRNNNNIFFK